MNELDRLDRKILAAFSCFLMDVLMPMPGMVTTRPSIVLESMKDSAALPIRDD